ncbi:MAG: hypothetical protein H6696_00415 [Deferribacteres bacterium]|nr:hypothetical protein [Deferribacteres bacterium]
MPNQDRDSQDANDASDVSKYIHYINGELSNEEMEAFEESLLKDKKNIKVLGALLKEINPELTPEEEIEFNLLYKKPKRRDRKNFIRAVIANSPKPAYKKYTNIHFTPAFKMTLALSFSALLIFISIKYYQSINPVSANITKANFQTEVKKDSLFNSLESRAVGDSRLNLRSMEGVTDRSNQLPLLRTQFETNYKYFRKGHFNLVIEHLQFIVNNPQYADDLESSFEGQLLLGDIQFLYAISHFSLALEKPQSEVISSEHLEKAIFYLKIVKKIDSQIELSNSERGNFFLGLAYNYQNDLKAARSCLSSIKTGSYFFHRAHKILSDIKQD